MDGDFILQINYYCFRGNVLLEDVSPDIISVLCGASNKRDFYVFVTVTTVCACYWWMYVNKSGNVITADQFSNTGVRWDQSKGPTIIATTWLHASTICVSFMDVTGLM